MSSDRDNEPFLSRWSRQKQQVREPVAKRQPPAPAKADDPELEIDLSKLPKLEELTAESDITGFLQKGVPEALQKLALRKMWSLDPGIRDFVEVAENQWDFNMPGGIHGLYQDLAEGTDTSVWMAQATQSVFGDDRRKLADAKAARDAGPSSGAEAEAKAGSAADAHVGANDEPHEPSDGKPPLELAVAVQPASAAVIEPPAQAAPPAATPRNGPTSPRRRHGGALPS
jgi:hypothetical protein